MTRFELTVYYSYREKSLKVEALKRITTCCKKSSSFWCVKSYMSVANFINNFRCSGFITAWKNICFVMWNGMPRLVVQ